MARRKTTEEFIKEAKEVHGDRYDYSLVDYKGDRKKVVIKCSIHGEFEKSPSNLLRGSGCGKCAGYNRNNDDIIRDFKNIHGDRYDYSLVEYIKSYLKVSIICKEHGVFKQGPSSHLLGKGCPICAGNVNYGGKEFIEKSKAIHGDKYDYSTVNYVKNRYNVDITCKKHGVFSMKPYNHLSGRGCYKCGRESIARHKEDNPVGWSITNWSKAAKKSNHFDSFKVYIIKCYNDNEEFYKIGRTFVKTKRRFSSRKELPYDYNILKEIIFDNAKDAFNKEHELKSINKKYKYIPKISFRGKQECFSKVNIFDL